MADDKELFELSRRKALAGLGTIGAASAGAGLGTSAFFSDTESFSGNSLTAGELDMKVEYSAHYSDWSSDEGDGVDVVMWDGAPNTTGTAGDLPTVDDTTYTGLPTNDAWLIAVDDPVQFLANTQYAEQGDASCNGDGDDDDADELDAPIIGLDDVKPGDFGEVTFDFSLCDNPGFVWLQGRPTAAAENGNTEPESKDDQETGADDESYDVDNGASVDDILTSNVELLDVVQAAYWVDDGDNYQDGDEAPAAVGSLREILTALSSGGALLEGDIAAEEGGGMGVNCFSGATEHSVAFAWWVPIDHGNEIQGDSVEFDLSFYTEQCRHNEQIPSITTSSGGGSTYDTGFGKRAENFDEPIAAVSRVRHGDTGWNVGAGTGSAPSDDTVTRSDLAQTGTTVLSDADWSFVYDASTDDFDFTVDGTTVSASANVSEMQGRTVIQTKADEATVTVSDVSLVIDGTQYALSENSVSASNDGSSRDLQYLVLNTSFDGSQSFTLSGKATVDVQGDYGSSDEGWAFDVGIE